jgi:predicted  nucleic acid-binding Zn-ribbon protein
MNFITRKVLEMQYKKLEDSKKRLNQHLEKRESLNPDDTKEIQKLEKYIGIWKKNIEKIEKEIKKIEDRESE